MSAVTLYFTCRISSFGLIGCQAQLQETRATGVLLEVLVMHELEHLLQSLEGVFQEPLEWQLVREDDQEAGDAIGAVAMRTFDLSLRFDQGSLIQAARLQFPVKSFPVLSSRQFARPANVVSAAWGSIECLLWLSQLQLTSDEQQGLEQGALLMIPESFQSVWTASLGIGGEEVVLGGEFQKAQDLFIRTQHDVRYTNHSEESPEASNKVSDTTPDEHYRVQLRCVVATEVLLNAQAPITIDMNREKPEAALLVMGRDTGSFCGSLLPVGSGQALLLESAVRSER